MLFGVVHRFQHIDFASELERIAIATVRMQHDRIRRFDVAALPHSLCDERVLAERLAATVEPKIEPKLIFARECIGVGNQQPVRLHRLIELGAEAPYDKSRLRCPRCFASEQLVSAFDSGAQHVGGGFHV